MWTLEKKSSIDGAWEFVSRHPDRETAREAGRQFKAKYANAARLKDSHGAIADEWPED